MTTGQAMLIAMGNLMETGALTGPSAAKVQRVKREIAAGTYESEHKLDVAADELLDDINREGEEAERFENSY